MLSKIIHEKPKIHTRNISLSTYPHNNSEIIVEGVLTDKSHQDIFSVLGKIKPPGTIHHMVVRLLIKGDPLRIAHAEAQMHHVPMDACRGTLDILEKIIGIEVKSGYSNTIRKTIGGKTGCTHLTHLVTVMGKAIVHGWLTQKRRERSAVPASIDGFEGHEYILNSCKMWTRDGPRWKKLEKALQEKRKQP